MPSPELTAEQIAERERERVEQQCGGTEGAHYYYGHLQTLLHELDQKIREGSTSKIPKDEGYLEKMRDRVMERMKQLGLPVDPVGYESEDDDNPFQDLRE